MSLAVVAYPVLAPRDQAWIDARRAALDPRAGFIRAHATLVFPCDAVGIDAHVAAVAATQPRIPFVLREVRAVRDHATGRGGHVFLVPDEGADAITALHDRLYAGPLAAHLRADLPFVPHVTVAADADFDACERVADRLRGELQPIRAVLDAADLIEIEDGVVRTVASHRLSGTVAG